MHEGKQPEREPVVLTINLKSRALPATAALAAFAVLPFLGAGANPAVGSPAGRLAAGTPTPALVADAGGPGPALYARAAQPGAAAAGAPMAFPNLALGPALPGGIDPAGVPGSLSALYAGNLVGAPGSVSGGPASWGAFAPWAPTSGSGSSWSPWAGGALPPAGAVGTAGFIRPVDAPETSGFGPRRHPVLGRAMFHTGIDLGAVCGTPIRAAADGTVVYAATTASWGNRIIIQHSPTLKTAYGHQSRLIAKVGQTVKQGDVIGLVGTTGWSTGCHLHFDVVLDGRYVDPAPYLGFASGDAASVPFTNPGSGTHSPSAPGTPSTPAVPDGDVPLPAASPTPPRPSTPATPSSSSSSSPAPSPTSSPTSRPGTGAPKPTPSTTTPRPTSSSGTPKPTTGTGTPKPTTGTPKPTASTGTPKPTTTTTRPGTTPPTTGTGTTPPTTPPTTTATTTAPTTPPTSTTSAPSPGATSTSPTTSATPTSSTPTPTTSDTCSPGDDTDPTGNEAAGATPAPASTSTGAPTDTCAPDAASAAGGGDGAPVPQALAATAEAVLDTVG